MGKVISIKHGEVRAILQTPPTVSKTVLLFIPGVSGEALTDRYKLLVKKALQRGLSVMRMQSWEQTEDLERKSIQQIHDDIDAAVEYLKEKGYQRVVGVGKSFGGSMLLVFRHPMIKRLILWAPALGVVNEGGNIESRTMVPLSQITSLFDITVDKKFLSTIGFPVKVIHGTADTTVPTGNSRKLIKLIPGACLEIIEGMGHSYKTFDQEKKVIEATLDFAEKESIARAQKKTWQ